MSDPARTRLVLVARAQKSTLDEVARTHAELAEIGLSKQHLVINGVLPAVEAEHDMLAAAVYRREQAAIAEIPAALRQLPLDQLPLKAFNMVGVEALRRLFNAADDAGAVAPEIRATPAIYPASLCLSMNWPLMATASS